MRVGHLSAMAGPSNRRPEDGDGREADIDEYLASASEQFHQAQDSAVAQLIDVVGLSRAAEKLRPLVQGNARVIPLPRCVEPTTGGEP